ncbi:NAD(P)/FAD-dependent oxidoreductase [Mycoplasmopsis pullorum]|uniref:Thioredoxin reductase n=1 Tax=Mycoplasmopsis pullorum TaxID=48003 RepID=A0A1L4FS14_9BACT|nr:FAD-dependent oxidoreductase [Mycoplasmopsis pullorum]APJ38398.1 thioredoxin reductase [Mycoplasmopsis pullorum]TNK84030.1 FAD-binding protein [Mycoplasmopsis pullorum]TNK92409.1 FAD-binding protein [Mycoplasmopsis pullorum]
MNNKIWDLLIIGSGPAGLNAALYASRANLSVMFVEKGTPGGKLSSTSKIENWLGTEMAEGWEVATEFFNHAQKFGAVYKYGEVVNIESISDFEKETTLKSGEVIKSKTVLIATGMLNRVPSFVKNLDRFTNRGVSYCAICDGPIFKNMPALVLGGGNSAVEEATYLSSIASKVYVLTKDAEFTAEKRLVEDLLSKENVECFYNSQLLEIGGDNLLEYAIFKDENGQERKIEINSFFPYIGMIPASDFAKNLNLENENGFFIVDELTMSTNVPGIYVAGDIRVKNVRQIVTAAGDGAIAAKAISDYLS